MTIAGSLAFNPGATYAVYLNPATSTYANVTGTAALAGTVSATFASGSYVSKNYTILQSAGLGGTTFNGIETINLPAGFMASLAYTSDDVLLDLKPGLSTAGLNTNQRNVGNALETYFDNGGALPPGFAAVFGLTGSNLGYALSQLSGEAATGADDGAFQMTDQFLALMLDPFVDGRGTGATLTGPGGDTGGSADNGGNVAVGANDSTSTTPLAYAGDAQSGSQNSTQGSSAQLALASLPNMKEPPSLLYQPRFSAWASGYGGLDTIDGSASIGSSNLNADTYGSAAGLDYHLDPNTVVGLALAGAGMGWDLANGLGGGRGNAFQAGLYGATRFGPVYVAGAFAFTNHWLTTNRTSFMGDALTANFDAQSYGGRIEAGYRIPLVLPILSALLPGLPSGPMEIVPYAAVQPQLFHTPAYSETDVSGGGFGLSYNAANATDVRSELGFRSDMLLAIGNGMTLDLFSRTAWAHDFLSTPSLQAVFETLPGASFVVNGATPARNSALLTSGAELRLTPALSILAKFDEELAPDTQTYAGTGTIRYVW
jgi:outer membrane autotransporter protein